MGLNLQAVSQDFDYENDIGVEYADTAIGYFGWKIFRDNLLSVLTYGRLNSLEDLNKYFGVCWYDDETYKIAMKVEDFSEGIDKERQEYLDKLEILKKEFPKLYDCFALIEHSDCEGEMPYEQVETALPHLRYFIDGNNNNFGYGNTKEILEVFESCVKNKGKVRFT